MRSPTSPSVSTSTSKRSRSRSTPAPAMRSRTRTRGRSLTYLRGRSRAHRACVGAAGRPGPGVRLNRQASGGERAPERLQRGRDVVEADVADVADADDLAPELTLAAGHRDARPVSHRTDDG